MRDLGVVQAGRQRSPHFKIGSMRPYLRVANVQDGWIDFSDIKQMAFTESEAKIYELKAGDILLSEGQSLELVGRPAMYNGDLPGCCFQNTLVRLRANQHDAHYLFYVCRYLYVLGKFQKIAKKTTSIAHLGVSRFADLKTPIAPLPEQRKIAEILSTWDEALEKLDALIVAKERSKKALIKQLLIARHNPSNGKNQSRHLKASEIFTNRSERNTGSLPVLSVTQDQGVVLRSSLDRRIAHDEDNTSTYKVVRAGDYVISLRSFQGGLEYSSVSGAVSPAYHVIRAIKEIDQSFYRHYFKSRDFISRLASAIIGIRDGKQISFTDFGFIKLPYPKLEEQKRIGVILDTAEQELSLLRNQRASLDQQKRGLMQRLLTGKVRVKTIAEDYQQNLT